MSKTKRIPQAHRQAPWRLQTQRLVIVLIAVVLGASVLWLMLNVTVHAGAAGQQILRLEEEQEDLQRQIASLRTEYATLTSADRMSKRAIEMGYEQVKPENITYVIVPGYSGRQVGIAAAPPRQAERKPLIKPVYTQSLWEWLLQGVLLINEKNSSTQPDVFAGRSP
jgi:hypothetical protein